MSEARKAACLCGAVAFTAALEDGAGACHCSSCRKWSGGPLMTVNAAQKPDFEGEENISLYKSSDWAERGFCKKCGSNLFYHLFPRPGMPDGQYILAAGLFEDQSGFKFDHEVFIEENPGWFEFSGNENRKRMTGAELFASAQGGQEG